MAMFVLQGKPQFIWNTGLVMLLFFGLGNRCSILHLTIQTWYRGDTQYLINIHLKWRLCSYLWIKDSALIVENTGQRKPILWHVLRSVLITETFMWYILTKADMILNFDGDVTVLLKLCPFLWFFYILWYKKLFCQNNNNNNNNAYP